MPTYNERDNARKMFHELLALDLDADLLFLDDNSPDGTGQLLDELAATTPRAHVIHRPGKLGVGGAHIDAINWAYDHDYARMITLDCDFTHSPSDIIRLLEFAGDHDVVVGSRYLQKGSLPGWNLLRRVLTSFGHFLTKGLLGIPYDATGAFRVYNLDKIPRPLFSSVNSKGYSFFFESMFLMTRNNVSIHEVGIVLPARTYGTSKMALRDAVQSANRVLRLFFALLSNPAQFRIGRPFAVNPDLVDPQGWDAYWQSKSGASNVLYDIIATVYRNLIIKRNLNRAIRRHFPKGSRLLHAGCGSGHVDVDLQHEMRLTGVDISVPALHIYSKSNPSAEQVTHASIYELPFDSGSFDGAYNLGVVEHFTKPELEKIFVELARVVKEDGKVVIFWPHARATSVFVLHGIHWVLNRVLKKRIQLHPPEVSLLRSRQMVEPIFNQAGFDIIDYKFGISDLWVQVVIVAQKRKA